jgi:serine/threonine-protein kinase
VTLFWYVSPSSRYDAAVRQMPLAVGQVVADRYRVERVLGHGGMGIVVAARHIELDEVFALKVMTAEAFESPESVERFIREARTTAKLKSTHAVKVVDTGRLHDGAPFLAMEYLQGRDLEKELAARGPLPAAEAAGYLMQACDVLQEAHGLGIVHRDIKPANIFLARLPNGSVCVKVLDFGIAKSDHAQGPRMTQTASVFGTPLYMSPEQMRSSKSADPRSDIWSLGVVLYELCTGAVPYDGESMTALVALVMTELPVPPSRRRAGIGADLEGVIMRCLQRDPAYRYPTAAALAQALAPIAQGYRTAQPSFPDASWAPHRGAPSGPVPFTQPWSAASSPPGVGHAPSVPGATGPAWTNAGTQSALTT